MNRRKFIKAGTGILTISTLGMASGTVSAGESITQNEKLKLIRKARKEGGADEMERVMKELDMEYVRTKGERTVVDGYANESEQGNGEFSTQDRYSESESDVDVFINPASGDRVRVTVVVNLTGHRYRLRQVTSVEDVIAVGFDNLSWTSVGTTTLSASDPHEISLHSDSLDAGGVAGAVDLNFANDGSGPYLPDGCYISLETLLEHRSGNPVGTVYGSYHHNRAYPGTGSIESITGGGTVGVNLSTSASTAWYDVIDRDPEPLL